MLCRARCHDSGSWFLIRLAPDVHILFISRSSTCSSRLFLEAQIRVINRALPLQTGYPGLSCISTIRQETPHVVCASIVLGSQCPTHLPICRSRLLASRSQNIVRLPLASSLSLLIYTSKPFQLITGRSVTHVARTEQGSDGSSDAHTLLTAHC